MISTATEYDWTTGLEFIRFEKLNTKIAAPFATMLKSENGIQAVYFFGVVNKQGSQLLTQKRIVIIGSTALYQCSPEAEMNRCVPIKDIQEVIVTEDNWIGLRVPSQYDIMFQCLTTQDARNVQRTLSVLMRHHTNGSTELVVRHTPKSTQSTLKAALALGKPSSWTAPAPHPLKVISWDEISRRRAQGVVAQQTDDRIPFLEERILEYEDKLFEEQALMEQLDVEATKYREEAERKAGELEKVMLELQDVRQRLMVQEQLVVSLKQDVTTNQVDKGAQERQLGERDATIRVTREQLQHTRTECETVRRELFQTVDLLRAETLAKNNAEGVIQTLKHRVEELETSSAQLREEKSSWMVIRNELQLKLQRLTKYEGINLEEIQKTTSDLLEENGRLREELTTLEGAMRSNEARMFEMMAELKELYTFRESVEDREEQLRRREVRAATALRDAEGILFQKDQELKAASHRVQALAAERQLAVVLKRKLEEAEQKVKDLEILIQVSTKVWGENQMHYQSTIAQQAMEMETLTLKLKDVERYVDQYVKE
eukprot:PhF_6_TR21171/c0_g1_i1/m.30508